MKKKVKLNSNCIKGISKAIKGFSEYNIIACDTETIKGEPYTLQMYDGENILFQYVNADNILDVFINFIEEYGYKKRINVCYFHNLTDFDLTILFRKYLKELYKGGTEIEINHNGNIFLIFKSNNICFINGYLKNGYKVKILDSMSFTQLSLQKSLEAFNINKSKLERPENLGSEKLNTEEFRKYAINDVIVLYDLVKKIKEFHKIFDVSISVSIAQFSMKVFRKNYLKKNEIIDFNPRLIEIAERSYHGGKNYYAYKEPKLFENLTEIDINSSYPYAVSILPSFVKGYTKVKSVKNFNGNLFSLFRIKGKIKSSRPMLFSDDFKEIQGDFDDVCITGYELDGIIKYAEVFDFSVIEGYEIIDEYNESPFKRFINDLYQKRLEMKKEGNKGMETIYKYILNSFYGKFIQTNEVKQVEFISDLDDKKYSELKQIIESMKNMGIEIHGCRDKFLNEIAVRIKEWHAGLYYNPVVATFITSIARRRLLDLEMKFKSIHSATDSIKTEMKVEGGTSELGGYKKEVEGRCFIFRNKLYLHFAKDFSNCKHKPEEVKYWDNGQHLCKYALHGYRGSLEDLYKNRYKLLKERRMEYEYTKVVKLKEGLKQGLIVNDFIRKSEILNLIKDIEINN